MMTFISCAKTMTDCCPSALPPASEPAFLDEARRLALSLGHYTPEEWTRLLHVSPQIAARTSLQLRAFNDGTDEGLPALAAYTGMVFRHIRPQDFSPEDWTYAQDHLLISSFLYGLLRPCDRIRNYRLEGHVRLPEEGHGDTLFAHWRPRLTEAFISAIRRQGGVLVNLASAEMKKLFDWKAVEQHTRVVTPDFHTLKGGKLKSVTVYAKMCRGEMVRLLLKKRIEDPEELKAFDWEGYRFRPEHSTENRWTFALEA